MSKAHRPLSPHLTIYKPQITSIMSISHRLTGVVLYLGFISLMWLAFWYRTNPLGFIQFTNQLQNCWIFHALLSLWLYCLYHHTFLGIRYLIWSQQKGFSRLFVVYSAWIAMGAALATTIAITQLPRLLH